MLTDTFIQVVQKIERISQMQWTNKEYLESVSYQAVMDFYAG